LKNEMVILPPNEEDSFLITTNDYIG